MNQEDIQMILNYCKPDKKYFEVSKVFETIYVPIFYISETVDCLFSIAHYQDNIIVLNILKDKGLINSNNTQTDWKQINKNKIEIDFDHIDRYYVTKQLDALSEHKNTINNRDISFVLDFISYFHWLSKKFIVHEPINTWTYKSYEVRYCVYWWNERSMVLIDHDKTIYLSILFSGTIAKIHCNLFNITLQIAGSNKVSELLYACDEKRGNLWFVLSFMRKLCKKLYRISKYSP